MTPRVASVPGNQSATETQQQPNAGRAVDVPWRSRPSRRPVTGSPTTDSGAALANQTPAQGKQGRAERKGEWAVFSTLRGALW